MKIVFVDDEQSILNSIKRNLAGKKDEWNMFFLSDSLTAAEKIIEEMPDLIVTDANMPGVNGVKLLTYLKANERTKDIPAIMLTGFSEEDLRQEALKAGAIEFVSKPVYPSELILRIENILKLKKIINELELANLKLEEYSNTDSLTGAYNRRYLFNHLHESIAINKRYGHPFLLFMFDIDGFKSINDVYGHQAGDNLLVDIASTLKKTLRDTDKVCRYGGDEFVVVLAETGKKEAVFFRERILEEMREIESNGNKITISGGIVEYQGETIEKVIKRADDLIYVVKKEGKNNIIIG